MNIGARKIKLSIVIFVGALSVLLLFFVFITETAQDWQNEVTILVDILAFTISVNITKINPFIVAAATSCGVLIGSVLVWPLYYHGFIHTFALLATILYVQISVVACLLSAILLVVGKCLLSKLYKAI